MGVEGGEGINETSKTVPLNAKTKGTPADEWALKVTDQVRFMASGGVRRICNSAMIVVVSS